MSQPLATPPSHLSERVADLMPGHANIHGPNERVIVDELDRSTLAIADLLGRLAVAAREEQSP